MFRVHGSQAAADISAWLQSQGLTPRAAQAVKGLGPQLDQSDRFDRSADRHQAAPGAGPDTTRLVPDRRHRSTHRTRDPVGGRLRRTIG